LNVAFTSASAVGFDFFPGLAAGNVVMTVFSPSNVLLGTFAIAAPLGASFFGVISDAGPASIGRINVASQSISPGELIDNLAFDNAVPEPTSLLFLGTGLVAIVLTHQRKRYQVQLANREKGSSYRF